MYGWGNYCNRDASAQPRLYENKLMCGFPATKSQYQATTAVQYVARTVYVMIASLPPQCPWMGRCIGYRNHKLFYMFTFYGFLLALFYVIVTLIVAIRHFSGDMPMDTYITVLDIVILISTFLFGGCFVGGLFFSHTLLLLQNKTTFERLRPQKSVLDLPPNERLFDIGWRANWAAVMGPNPMMWLVPVPTRYVTDGCSFPLNSKAKGDGAHAV